MIVPVLALCTRALRLESRSWKTLSLRLTFIIFVSLSLVSIVTSFVFGGAAGLSFFLRLSYNVLIFVTLYGISAFSTTITEEKEAQTLGLLKMSGIHPVGILLGKSTSLLISALLLIAAVFPFAMLAVTLGGVSYRQINATFIALMAHIIMLSNVGLFFSVLCNRARSASSLTLLFVLGYNFVPIIFTAILQLFSPSSHWLYTAINDTCTFLTNTSAFTQLSIILSTGFNESMISTQVWFNFLIGIVFFGLSLISFERFTKNPVPVGPKRVLGNFKKNSNMKKMGAGRATKNAIVWRDYNFIFGGHFQSLIRCLIYLIIMVATILITTYTQNWKISSSTIEWEDSGNFLMIIYLVLFIFIIASRLSTSFSREKKWHTFSNLLMLPHDSRHIMVKKIACCFKTSLPIICFFALSTLFNFDNFTKALDEILTEPLGWASILFTLLFWYLTIYLALRLKFGALIVSLFFMYFVNFLVMGIIGLIFSFDSDAAALFCSVIYITLISLLHIKLIPNRMKAIALANS